MIRKMFTTKTVIVLLILIGMSNGQDKTLLNDLRIDVKQNGCFFNIAIVITVEN